MVNNDLKLRDSYIRVRGDDFSRRTYINDEYPTLRCSDPEFEGFYDIRLICLSDPKDRLLEEH